jgi:hypothetical protein
MYNKKNKHKNKKFNNVNTLDAEHKKLMNKFDKNENDIDKMKSELIKCEKEYKKLTSNIDQKCNEIQLQNKHKLSNKIDELNRNILKATNSKEKINYFFKSLDILTDYYDNLQKQRNKLNNNFSIKNYDNDIENEDEEYHYFYDNNENIDNINQISKYVKITTNFDKQKIYDKYKFFVDDNNPLNKYENDNIWLCKECNKEKCLDYGESKLICTNCFTPENIIIDSEKPSFKDPVQDNSYFHYQRINHFKEWVYKFQAKESTEISKEVYDNIKNEIIKLRIKDLSKITKKQMKYILKKINYNKYYEHIPHIINKLNGKQTLKLSRQQEEKMYSIFMEIHNVFEDVRPSTRVNFLSYSYVLYKICELLELDNFLKCFPLLKNPEKLHTQDMIWKKICAKLDYEFYPSI